MSQSQLEKLRADVKANLDERAEHQKAYDEARSKLDQVTGGAEQRGDGVLTGDETQALKDANTAAEAARAEMKKLDEERSQIEQRIEDIESADEARKAAEASAKKYGGTDPVTVRVGAEPQVYRKGGDDSFFADFYRMRYDGDPESAERILRHQRMQKDEARAVGTSAFAGLVVPQFLTDDFAGVARAGRPFVDFIGSRDLPPEGMTLNVPKGNTGTIVGSQTQENANVDEQDYDAEDIVVPVRTIAGQQNMSRQSIDRGRNTDGEIMTDLAEAYAAEQDRQAINGSGVQGQHLGLLSTTNVATITASSTNGINQVRLVAGALSSVHSNRFMPATIVVVHPRRWAYWAQSTDSQGRPLVVSRGSGPQNAFGTGGLEQASGIVGDLYGMIPVLADANIPTTVTGTTQGDTDVIIVTRASDLRLYEDSPVPRRVRFEETLSGQLSVKIVAFDYSAFTAGRYPTSSVVLTGDGLRTPVFGQ